jgi:hypothetical protein
MSEEQQSLGELVEGEIYKVQKPIIGKDWLIYNQDRSKQYILTKTTKELRRLMGTKMKVYIQVVDGQMVEIEEQDW